MNTIARVGVDPAKHVLQVHAVDSAGNVITNRALARGKFVEWCVQLPSGRLVAMEASSGAHFWSRKLIAMGLHARIIPGPLAAPYRLQGRGGKNDANDAAAICEAASGPQMHFVPPKTVAQQGTLCVHRLREGVGRANSLYQSNPRPAGGVRGRARSCVDAFRSVCSQDVN